MTVRVWRTESREVWPFAHARAAFENCALRLDANEEFDPRRSTFALDDQALSREVCYELLLRIDARKLREATEVAASEIDVALVLENDGAKRHDVLKRVSLEELPSRFEGVVSQARFGPRRARLRLVAFLVRERTRTKTGRAAWRAGSVLAERRFSIGPSADSFFRVHWTRFAEQQGWEPRAIWHVHVRSGDLLFSDADPDEVIQVHLNQDLPALVALWEASATRNQDLSPVAALLRPLMASEILSGLAAIVLRQLNRLQSERDDFDPEQIESSIGAILLTGLKKGTRLSTAELIRLAMDEPESLKMKIQGAVGVGKNYGQAMLERLRS